MCVYIKYKSKLFHSIRQMFLPLVQLRTYLDAYILIDIKLPTQVSKVFSKAIWSEKPLMYNYWLSPLCFHITAYVIYIILFIYLIEIIYLSHSMNRAALTLTSAGGAAWKLCYCAFPGIKDVTSFPANAFTSTFR